MGFARIEEGLDPSAWLEQVSQGDPRAALRGILFDKVIDATIASFPSRGDVIRQLGVVTGNLITIYVPRHLVQEPIAAPEQVVHEALRAFRLKNIVLPCIVLFALQPDLDDGDRADFVVWQLGVSWQERLERMVDCLHAAAKEVVGEERLQQLGAESTVLSTPEALEILEWVRQVDKVARVSQAASSDETGFNDLLTHAALVALVELAIKALLGV